MVTLRRSSQLLLVLMCLALSTSCSNVQHSSGASWACYYADTHDLAAGASSLALLTPIGHGTEGNAGEGVPAAFVRLDSSLGGVVPGSSFSVINPEITDTKRVSEMRLGVQYLAYLKPLVDKQGSVVKGTWMTVGGPRGIWRSTSSGAFEPVWNDPGDPVMPRLDARRVAHLPRPSKTVQQVASNPTSCP